MSHLRNIGVPLTLIALSSLGTIAQAQTTKNIPVVNPSFEATLNPAFPGTFFSKEDVPGFTGTTNGGFNFGEQSNANGANPQTTDGTQYAFINTGSLLQTVNATLTAGDTYTLTASLSGGDATASNPTLSINDGTGIANGGTTADPTVLVTQAFAGTAGPGFTPVSVSFIATAAQARSVNALQIQLSKIGGTETFFDTVRLTQTAPAAAPEPSQFAALGLGVLGLAGLAFKARKRSALTA